MGVRRRSSSTRFAGPADASAWRPSANARVIFTSFVASSGTRVIGMPDAKTASAAVGSAAKFHSAGAGLPSTVALPSTSTAPPMMTIRAMPSASFGSAARAWARFVMGPVARTVTGRSLPPITSVRRSTAVPFGVPGTPATLSPQSPSAPVRHSSGKTWPPATGSSEPHAVGTAGACSSLSRLRTFLAPGPQCAIPVPVTVTARISTPGCAVRYAIAITSSKLMSLSMMSGMGPLGTGPVGTAAAPDGLASPGDVAGAGDDDPPHPASTRARRIPAACRRPWMTEQETRRRISNLHPRGTPGHR